MATTYYGTYSDTYPDYDTTDAPTTQLAAPANFRQTGSTGTTATLAWNAVQYATGYRLLRGGNVQIGVSGTTYTGEPGSYQVQALYGPNTALNSGYSAAIQAVVAEANAIPGLIGNGQSNFSSLARQIDRSGAQLGPFPNTLIHNDDTNAEEPLLIGRNEAGLNGLAGYPDQPTSYPYVRASDGATILQDLAPYYDGFGAERRFAERRQAAGAPLFAYFKPNVEHISSTQGAAIAVLKTQFAAYSAQFNRSKANHAAAGRTLMVGHMLWNQGESEPNSTSYVSDLNGFVQQHRDLVGNQRLKIMVVRTRGLNNKFAGAGLNQIAYVAQEPDAVLFDDPNQTFVATDGDTHIDADTQDRVGDGVTDFVNGNYPTITSFTPTQAAPGTAVVITGTNLNGAQLRIGGVPVAQAAYNASGTSANVVVGAGAETGNVEARSGLFTALKAGYLAAPTFTADGARLFDFHPAAGVSANKTTWTSQVGGYVFTQASGPVADFQADGAHVTNSMYACPSLPLATQRKFTLVQNINLVKGGNNGIQELISQGSDSPGTFDIYWISNEERLYFQFRAATNTGGTQNDFRTLQIYYAGGPATLRVSVDLDAGTTEMDFYNQPYFSVLFPSQSGGVPVVLNNGPTSIFNGRESAYPSQGVIGRTTGFNRLITSQELAYYAQ
jgi:hypothetical protein